MHTRVFHYFPLKNVFSCLFNQYQNIELLFFAWCIHTSCLPSKYTRSSCLLPKLTIHGVSTDEPTTRDSRLVACPKKPFFLSASAQRDPTLFSNQLRFDQRKGRKEHRLKDRSRYAPLPAAAAATSHSYVRTYTSTVCHLGIFHFRCISQCKLGK